MLDPKIMGETVDSFIRSAMNDAKNIFTSAASRRLLLSYIRIANSFHMEDRERLVFGIFADSLNMSLVDLHEAIYCKSNLLTIQSGPLLSAYSNYLALRARPERGPSEIDHKEVLRIEANFLKILQGEEDAQVQSLLSRIIDDQLYELAAEDPDYWVDLLRHTRELEKYCNEPSSISTSMPLECAFVELNLNRYLSSSDFDRLLPLAIYYSRLLGALDDTLLSVVSQLSIHLFPDIGICSHGVAYRLGHQDDAISNILLNFKTEVGFKSLLSALEFLLTIGEFSDLPITAHHNLTPETSPRKDSRETATPSKPHVLHGDQLNRVVDASNRAWSWIVSNLESFSPLSHTNRDRLEFSTKMLAELSFAASMPSEFPDIEQVRLFCAKQFEQPFLLSFLLQHPTKLPLFSIASSILKFRKLDDGLLDRLRITSQHDCCQYGEFGAAVNMDIVCSILGCGFPWRGVSVDELYKRSLLSSISASGPLKDHELYFLTHTVFFCTDFGGRRPPYFQEMRAFFQRNSEFLLFSLSCRANWDLLAEILLCMMYLRIDLRGQFYRYLNLLLSKQEPAGSFVSEAANVDDVIDDQWRHVLIRYHTTLIFVLISSELSRPNLFIEVS